MIIRHTPDTITIRQFSRFEKTKDQKHLLRWTWLIWITHNDIFIQDFNKMFSDKKDNDLDNELLKLLAQNKILLLQALLTAINFHLSEKVQLELLKGNKTIPIDEKLAYYIQEAENATGIKINETADILALAGELERRIDKYHEIFPDKPQQEHEGVNIMQLAFSVGSIMNINIDPSVITVSELAELKLLAYERIRQQQEEIEKMKR